MKLVILNGGSCSGKTTIIKDVLKQKENYFHLGYDSIKWQFSQYSSGKYFQDVHQIMFAMLDVLCKLKHNIICEAYHQTTRQKLIDLAKEHGYKTIEINLEADYDVLLKRFTERVAGTIVDSEIKVANRSIERFDELYKIYQDEKNSSAITFRTDTQSKKEVSKSVLKLL